MGLQIAPVVLSGGSGTRLWPLSRKLFPKQLLPLVGEQTMLQETVSRLKGMEQPIATLTVVCNEEHRFLVAEQLREAGQEGSRIILEPVGRNTAPALTLAALALSQQQDALMLVMPADHVIHDVAAFHAAVAEAASLAERDYLVTFGITPDGPETGYGYIRKGEPLKAADHANQGDARCHACGIDIFVEKPDRTTAEEYVGSGEYLWNSGMFMMKASVWLDALRHCRSDILESCQRAFERGCSDRDFYRIDAETFGSCPEDSIDYAVMEKINREGAESCFRSAVIPLTAGWSDVGAWPALWDTRPKDQRNNVVKGDVLTENTSDSLLYSSGRLLTAIGVKDLIVVETADAVLVAHKDAAQDVKSIVTRIEKAGRDEHLVHRRVHRPWGTYEGIDVGERYQVKRITVDPGAALSLQMHHHRAEHWIVVKGTAKVTRGDEEILVSENQSTYIPLGVKHRLENPGTIPLEMIEVQSGSYLGEDDIVRFEDQYGRGA